MCGALAIFGLAIHGSVRKRPASMPAALRVSGCGSHAQRWERQRQGRAMSRRRVLVSGSFQLFSFLAFDFLAPPAAATDRKPRRGGGHGWPPFSDRGRMPSPKIPRTPTFLERSVEEGAFFWLLFFAPAKKSNSPAGESSAPRDITPDLSTPAATSIDPRLRGSDESEDLRSSTSKDSKGRPRVSPIGRTRSVPVRVRMR